MDREAHLRLAITSALEFLAAYPEGYSAAELELVLRLVYMEGLDYGRSV